VKRIDLDGGPSRTLAPAPNGRGGTWNADDVILFCPGTSAPIYRVSANGTAVRQTTLSTTRHEMSHRWPQFLPDGRHFIYLSRSQDEGLSGIFLASLDSPEVTFVVSTGFGASYAPTGTLLYVADEALMAAPFDVASRRLTDDPRPIVADIATASSFYSAFSVSGDVFAYASRSGFATLAWLGRDGRQLGAALAPGNYVDFQISRDGRYVAVAQIDQHVEFPNLRIVDLKRGTNLVLTTSPATDASPVWSPDGTRIVFRSNRELEHDLYVQSANGGGEARFLKTPTAKYPTHWSPDGKFVVYHSFDDETRFDIWAAPVDHPESRYPLVRTKADETQGQISPNNKWLAYTSNISSRLEVYVQLMTDDGRKWPISVDGGSNPKWSADSRELFYLAPDNRLMSVDVAAAAGAGLEPGTPRALFSLSDVSITRPFLNRWYDVDPTGTRFLVRIPAATVQTAPLTVLVHWSSLPRLWK
jgi:Tol biopolymer transport system component